MKLPFSFFLALRYLKPKRTFVSIITLISMAGVMLGVTVLILVISVMTGFDRELRQKVIDFDAHILVGSEDVLRDWRELTVKIRNTPGVVGTAPYVQGPVIVEFRNQRLAPLIRGIDPVEEEKVVPLKKFMKKGTLDLEGESTVLGVELARKLHIDVGDKLTIYSPGNLGEILDGIKALEKTKGNANGDALVEAMKGMSWESPRGPISIDPATRDIVQNIYVRKVEKKDGELYNVEFQTFDAVKKP